MVTSLHSNVMLQHKWSVNYESCHQLPIWWNIITHNAISYFWKFNIWWKRWPHVETENRTPQFIMLSLSYNHSMPQASSCLLFPDNSSLRHCLNHLTARFPSLLEPRLEELSHFPRSLIIFKVAETNTLTSSSCGNDELQIVCSAPMIVNCRM